MECTTVPPVTTEQIQAYVAAWRSYDRAASYEPSLIAGDRVIATGETRYADGNVFSNLFDIEFGADGRCSSFVEWYVHHPRPKNGNGAG